MVASSGSGGTDTTYDAAEARCFFSLHSRKTRQAETTAAAALCCWPSADSPALLLRAATKNTDTADQ